MTTIREIQFIAKNMERPETVALLNKMTGHFSTESKWLEVPRETYCCIVPKNMILKGAPDNEYVEFNLVPFFGLMADYNQGLDLMVVWAAEYRFDTEE